MHQISRFFLTVLFVIIILSAALIQTAGAVITVRPVSPVGDRVSGNQWLFVIGINTYLEWPQRWFSCHILRRPRPSWFNHQRRKLDTGRKRHRRRISLDFESWYQKTLKYWCHQGWSYSAGFYLITPRIIGLSSIPLLNGFCLFFVNLLTLR